MSECSACYCERFLRAKISGFRERSKLYMAKPGEVNLAEARLYLQVADELERGLEYRGPVSMAYPFKK